MTQLTLPGIIIECNYKVVMRINKNIECPHVHHSIRQAKECIKEYFYNTPCDIVPIKERRKGK